MPIWAVNELEDGGQKTEIRGRRSENRSRKSDNRCEVGKVRKEVSLRPGGALGAYTPEGSANAKGGKKQKMG